MVDFVGLTAHWNPPESDHDMVAKFPAEELFIDPDQNDIVSDLRNAFEQPISDLHR